MIPGFRRDWDLICKSCNLYPGCWSRVSKTRFFSKLIEAEDSMDSPARALAVVLDVGTDNEDLLKDDLYMVSRLYYQDHIYCWYDAQGLQKEANKRENVRRFCGKIRRIGEKASTKMPSSLWGFCELITDIPFSAHERRNVGCEQRADVVRTLSVRFIRIFTRLRMSKLMGVLNRQEGAFDRSSSILSGLYRSLMRELIQFNDDIQGTGAVTVCSI